MLALWQTPHERAGVLHYEATSAPRLVSTPAMSTTDTSGA